MCLPTIFCVYTIRETLEVESGGMRILQLPFGEAREQNHDNGSMASREFPLAHSSQVPAGIRDPALTLTASHREALYSTVFEI